MITKTTKVDKIFDLGVAKNEFSPFDNYFEKRYPYTEQIIVLSIYDPKFFSKKYPKIKTVSCNGGRFAFYDNEFSIVVSNAVIEYFLEEKRD